MQTSSQPKLLPVPFADGGSKQTIPVASQIGITAGRASYTDGFPPLTRTPLAAGGVPPFGTDFNGVLNDITAAIRWKQSGAGYIFDSAFSTAISGYPKGAKLTNSTFDGFWLNTVNGNTSAPEVADSSLTGWIPADTYGVTSLTGLAGSSITLSSIQASRPRITLAGTLSSNINLTVPAWQKSWVIENNCTGAFSVTVKTPSGAGVAIPAGNKASVYGDGTNIIIDNQVLNVSRQVTGITGSANNLRMSIASASATASLTADEVIVATAVGGQQFRVSGVSASINIGTTGAGGMDVGSAPAPGFVAIYLIYNPTTQATALLAVNATSTSAPNVYAGSNMPAGYSASALLSVWRCYSGTLAVGEQIGKDIYTADLILVALSGNVSSLSSIDMSAYIPVNAKKWNGYGLINSTSSTANCNFTISAKTSLVSVVAFGTGNSGNLSSFTGMPIAETQRAYYTMSTSGPFGNGSVHTTGYTI